MDHANGYSLAIALDVLAVIVGSKKIAPKIPGVLIAVIGAIGVSWALNFKTHVHELGSIPGGGLPPIGRPEVKWSMELVVKLIPTAFAMFVVILAQRAATLRVYGTNYNERFSENRDLIDAGLSDTIVVNGGPKMITSVWHKIGKEIAYECIPRNQEIENDSSKVPYRIFQNLIVLLASYWNRFWCNRSLYDQVEFDG